MTHAKPVHDHPPQLAVVPSQKDWPTMYDLPSEYPEEEGLPDEFHSFQPQLLGETLRLTTVAEDQIFTGSDLNVYYDRRRPTLHKRPDWFAVAGVPRFYGGEDLRMSYVVWDEQVIPFVVVELLSPKTAKSDLGQVEREPDGTPTKWEVYEQILKVPTYVIFDRVNSQLRVFRLINGSYQEQTVVDNRFWLTDMSIGLGVWQGKFKGCPRAWIRWYDASGAWIATQVEQQTQLAETERQQREVAEQIADEERSRADRLAERLKELGIDPNDV